MDGNHPKRRKDKDNPYTITTGTDGRCWLSFTDGQDKLHQFEIESELFHQLNSFELDDLIHLNEVDRHYERSEMTESSLCDRAFAPPVSVEDMVLLNLRNEQLHNAIRKLPEIQQRRLILYYFKDMTYEQIAAMEGCSFQAVAKSISAAEKRIKKLLG